MCVATTTLLSYAPVLVAFADASPTWSILTPAFTVSGSKIRAIGTLMGIIADYYGRVRCLTRGHTEDDLAVAHDHHLFGDLESDY
jgi:hypothetical protein